MKPPLVVALVGLPGSGKSTLAGYLCERFALKLIDRDALRAELFPDCRFTEAEKLAANQAVVARLERHSARGESCLVDGMTFGRQSERDAAHAAATEHGARFLMLWLDCPVEVAAARVEAEPHPARDRTPALVREVAARFERPTGTAHIDATLPAAEIQRIAAAILTAVL